MIYIGSFLLLWSPHFGYNTVVEIDGNLGGRNEP